MWLWLTDDTVSFVVANARIVDYPVVYCSSGFNVMFGYNKTDVMHKSAHCRFMTGELTSTDSRRDIESAFDLCVTSGCSEPLELLLYKKNSKLLRHTRTLIGGLITCGYVMGFSEFIRTIEEEYENKLITLCNLCTPIGG